MIRLTAGSRVISQKTSPGSAATDGDRGAAEVRCADPSRHTQQGLSVERDLYGAFPKHVTSSTHSVKWW
jgi:hypothetical protein